MLFAIEMCMTLVLTFRMDQGQTQVEQSKAYIYDFPFIVNRNLYHICHHLRDNYMIFQNIANDNIWACDRSSKSRGITSPITYWMTNLFPYNLVKMEVLSQTVFVCFTNEFYRHTFYRISNIKRMENFHFVLKTQIWNVKKTTNTMVAKLTKNDPLRASVWLSVWLLHLLKKNKNEKEKNKKKTKTKQKLFTNLIY